MKTPPNVTKLLALLANDINGYEADDERGRAPLKEQFLRTARALLKQAATDLGLHPCAYDLRVNRSGVAGSGSVTLHADHLYVQFEQGSFRDRFMYRCCRDRKDYTGGPNEWMRWEQLRDWEDAIGRFNDTMKRGAPVPASL